jgi:hypothetical protein
MGFASLALTPSFLDRLMRSQDWIRCAGVLKDAEFVGLQYIPTLQRVYLAYKHPSLQGKYNDNYALMSPIGISLEVMCSDRTSTGPSV